ncbi:MAG: hypothetical protein D4R73_05955 [Deltaproteobacteria bacterium]|nr:MAG: hypothetical protein D4R73_05955 [Deltaproteobacteria bacterium]
MANRVTIAELREIFDTMLLDAVLTTFIGIANRVMTSYLGTTTLLTDAEKKDIELFLSAHLASTMRDPQAQSEGVTGGAGVSITYHGKSGLGLDGSHFGQTVKMLDRTGILALQKKEASVFAIPSFD